MKRLILGSAVALALAVAAPVGAASVRVRTLDDAYSPATLRVAKGTTVKWSNPTDDMHSISTYRGPASFDARLDGGQTFSKRLRKGGTYKYRCIFHSSLASDGTCNGMCGKIRVR